MNWYNIFCKVQVTESDPIVVLCQMPVIMFRHNETFSRLPDRSHVRLLVSYKHLLYN